MADKYQLQLYGVVYQLTLYPVIFLRSIIHVTGTVSLHSAQPPIPCHSIAAAAHKQTNMAEDNIIVREVTIISSGSIVRRGSPM
ncbi:hypothetical protein D3C87_1834170 [compost metagenome]